MITAVVAGAALIIFLALTGAWMSRRLEAQRVARRGGDERSAAVRAPSGKVQEGGALTAAQLRELERIATLGYISGSEPVPEETGVVTHLRDSTCAGYTLYSCAEGAEAFLIDMEGRETFRWSLPGAKYWSRVAILPGGDLLVITADPYRLMRLDANSELLWLYEKPAHHDFDILPSGIICVLVRDAARRDWIHGGAVILDDVIALIDPYGNELARVSILDAFSNSERYSEWLEANGLPDGPDILHTNSIQMIYRDGRAHALLSIRAIDTVAMLDMESRQIVWARKGPWRMQHEAMLIDGHMLVFDNLGEPGRSRVLEFDGTDGDIVWSYSAEGFLTEGVGAQQRLENGNTLITESEKGRLIEVTRAGTIVWEYINAATTARDPGTTLGIMRAERLPEEHPLDWMAVPEG